jgi:hypothetical protein
MVQARLEAANAQLASSLSARDTADIKAEDMLEQVRHSLPRTTRLWPTAPPEVAHLAPSWVAGQPRGCTTMFIVVSRHRRFLFLSLNPSRARARRLTPPHRALRHAAEEETEERAAGRQ